jgi:dihydrofolate reductase
MAQLRFGIAISLDGYVAGPNQSEQDPLGEGGMQLHEWVFELEAWRKPHGREGGVVNESTPVVDDSMRNVGATIMGRNMFGGGPGPWGDRPWEGWWGEDPPFHVPVFVLTNHEREPLRKEGGTTFYFVTEGIDAALEQAMAAAEGKDVWISGGAETAQQYLSKGLIDELRLSVVPVLLGGGTRLFADGVGAGVELEQVQAVEAPGVTHLVYRSG